MTGTLIEFVIVLIGLTATAILFRRFPVLPGAKPHSGHFPTVSVIIPARNEGRTLPLLLEDLKGQTLPAYEIICVDDVSEDATGQIALSYGAKLISIGNKPGGWTGKTWACHTGAGAAKGELLLFLDADVRLGKDGVRKLLWAYLEEGCTVSVQPYHRTEKLYEQLSLFFNLVQIAANGTALPRPLNIGLYGPVILIARSDYWYVGGHESVRRSVVEDMALGSQLKAAGLPYRLFVGDQDVAFRMYGDGLTGLFQGWIKSMAAGAARMPMPLFLMVFVWIASLISVPLHVVTAALYAKPFWLAIYSALYVVWMILLYHVSKRIGRFQLWAFVCYPVLVLTFLGVFLISTARRMLRLEVVWKGRVITEDPMGNRTSLQAGTIFEIEAKNCIPITWLALFDDGQLHTQTVIEDGEPYERTMLQTTAGRALHQLDATIARVKDRGPAWSYLRPLERLRDAISRCPSDTPVTVDVTEWLAIGEEMRHWLDDAVPAFDRMLSQLTGDADHDVALLDELVELYTLFPFSSVREQSADTLYHVLFGSYWGEGQEAYSEESFDAGFWGLPDAPRHETPNAGYPTGDGDSPGLLAKIWRWARPHRA